eukprot:scaffold22319_cov17-Tisochrysis_lutea.AAC.2
MAARATQLCATMALQVQVQEQLLPLSETRYQRAVVQLALPSPALAEPACHPFQKKVEDEDPLLDFHCDGAAGLHVLLAIAGCSASCLSTIEVLSVQMHADHAAGQGAWKSDL